MSAFAAYILGYAVLVILVAIAALLMDVPAVWVIIAVLIAAIVGFLIATSTRRRKEPPINR
jgi:general stress protein CsbA